MNGNSAVLKVIILAWGDRGLRIGVCMFILDVLRSTR